MAARDAAPQPKPKRARAKKQAAEAAAYALGCCDERTAEKYCNPDRRPRLRGMKSARRLEFHMQSSYLDCMVGGDGLEPPTLSV